MQALRETRPPIEPEISGAFHAVSIRAPARACDEAKSLKGTRFLAAEAPKLPVTDCSKPDCPCSYQHHNDRRQEPRRAREIGLPGAHYQGEERRKLVGRRRSDRPGELRDAADYYSYVGPAKRLE